MSDAEPAMAVVVLSQGPRPTLERAIASLVSQEPRPEIVVVHSGPGDPSAFLPAAADASAVRLVVVGEPVLPGAARNIGIRSSQAPFVAFLADDCEATSGWVAARLVRHRAGQAAVSSSLICHRPHHPVAVAAHLSLFVNRMPRTKPANALRYGASYARADLERLGPFREDLRGGEDTEFNARLREQVEIAWAPEVQTIHRGTESLREFVADQRFRGIRMVQTRRALDDGLEGHVARDAVSRLGATVRRSFAVVPPSQWLALTLALPIMAAGSVAYARGAAGEARPS